MKKFIFLFAFAGLVQSTVMAQTETPQETAKSFVRSGDFDNAILILTRALQGDQTNLELMKDLAMAYYYKRDFAQAKNVVESMLAHDNADVITYQISGNVYKALEEVKEADKMYKKGLKKFPKSGPLYSEYGELLWATKDYDAINQWEKGIKEDPSFAGNYYNAALFYFYTKDKIWSIIYGEIFVNMESLTERSTAMKQLILDAYKEKLFNNVNMNEGEEKNKNEFEKAYLGVMNKLTNMANKGITTESLTMIRTRFILDWMTTHGKKFPFRLFEYHQQLIREGMFEAYNQWLFGTVENLAAYDNWTKTHPEAYTKFKTFQQGRIFKMPQGHYYQD